MVAATEADLRINVEGPNGSVVGIENLTVGIPYAGFGILNYREPGQSNSSGRSAGRPGVCWSREQRPTRGLSVRRA